MLKEAAMTIKIIEQKSRRHIKTVDNLRDCLLEVRKYIKERLPDSNFLGFLEDSDKKPCIRCNSHMFLITDQVGIFKDREAILVESGNDLLKIYGIEFEEFVEQIRIEGGVHSE